MAHLKTLKPARKSFGLFPQGAQSRAGYLVLALHLFHHQFGVRYDPKTPCIVLVGPGEDGSKSLVFSEIVGLAAKEFAQPGDGFAVRIFNDRAVARRTRI